jgi:hypothetical protein
MENKEPGFVKGMTSGKEITVQCAGTGTGKSQLLEQLPPFIKLYSGIGRTTEDDVRYFRQRILRAEAHHEDLGSYMNIQILKLILESLAKQKGKA